MNLLYMFSDFYTCCVNVINSNYKKDVLFHCSSLRAKLLITYWNHDIVFIIIFSRQFNTSV